MNLVLFEPGEVPGILPLGDPRAVHLLDILKLVPGDRFVAGVVGGRRGSVALVERLATGLRLDDARWDEAPPELSRLRVLVGTPRPPTARRLLKDLTTLGVAEIHFVATELGDKNYLQSHLWRGEWREAVKEGASQNRSTLLPTVERHEHLGRWLEQRRVRGVRFDAGAPGWHRHPLLTTTGELWLAIGPERGWTDAERLRFDAAGWSTASLGPSVLRTETACALAVGLARLAESSDAPT